MKHCSHCFEVLPANENYFVNRKQNRDGLGAHCLECEKIRKKEYGLKNKEKIKRKRRTDYLKNKDDILRRNKLWVEKNREDYLARKRQYYNENKKELLTKNRVYRIEKAERIKDQRRSYRNENKLQIEKRNKVYYARNKEKIKNRVKKWCENNPEQRKFNNLIYRQRKRVLISTLTKNQWKHCLTHFNHQCAYCSRTVNLEQEHVMPVSKGGHYTADNIIPACRSCNASKHNKSLEEWYINHESYSEERLKAIYQYLELHQKTAN